MGGLFSCWDSMNRDAVSSVEGDRKFRPGAEAEGKSL